MPASQKNFSSWEKNKRNFPQIDNDVREHYLYNEVFREDYSWQENYVASSSLEPQPTSGIITRGAQLEMDGSAQRVGFCPLLAEPHLYIPDTVDLNSDHDARDYWLNCFESTIDKIVERAVMSQPDSESASDRANQFKEKYIRRLHHLRHQPFAYGNLTVRSLLDTIEHLLREFDFPDPYILVKQQENEAALSQLELRLEQLDGIEHPRKRWTELAVGVLAGNIFDWGARAIVDMMETSHQFGLDQAVDKIPKRPWLIDDLDSWLDRVCSKSQPPHHHAAVFIDNSGVDVVLGMMPFVRELLRGGTKVTMCANTHPALNDVTYSELEVILSQVGTICPEIASCLKKGSLMAMETAQAGPCLDLSRLSGGLVDAMKDVDLIILEGMGRSIHTNLYAKFTCESLRIACIKNNWLARRLGGDLFAAVFSYKKSEKGGS